MSLRHGDPVGIIPLVFSPVRWARWGRAIVQVDGASEVKHEDASSWGRSRKDRNTWQISIFLGSEEKREEWQLCCVKDSREFRWNLHRVYIEVLSNCSCNRIKIDHLRNDVSAIEVDTLYTCSLTYIYLFLVFLFFFYFMWSLGEELMYRLKGKF